MKNINIVGIIPARLNSSRYPGKPLINIKGLPMIEHVRRRVSLCKKLKRVIVATCDKEIKQVIEKYGGEVIMTSKNHIMASDRVYEASQKLNCTHIINIQGDEILVISQDDLHPNELGHKLWTDEVLIPQIQEKINEY